jgi:glycosyltransferase involved in cell wall biosynthesis
VDPDLFQRGDASGLRGRLGIADRFVIGYVGRIVKEKGIADLIQALVSLPESCVLMILGSGELEASMRKLSDSLGVASRILWVPRISSLEVPKYMNALDVLVLPSRTTHRWKEQFGRVLIEAMVCETPVVGSSSGEIPRVIGDGGLVFPEGNVPALVRHLHTLYEDSGIRAELGAKGRARVLGRFTHRRIAEETMKFYQGVLKQSGAPCADPMREVALGTQMVQGR